MDRQLAQKALVRYLIGLGIVMLAVFLPAGTLLYRGGWRLILNLFLPMLLIGWLLLRRDPSLLQKRLESKEKQSVQQVVVVLSAVMFLVGFLVAGLDFRFGWFQLPRFISHIAAVIFLLGYLMYGEVLRENSFLSRSVRVQKGQKVIDTGLYRFMRHPMYTATILMFTMMPLMLGSLIALPVFLIYPALIVRRIGNEEHVLTEELPGYSEYKKKVRYKLFPRIW